MMVDHAEIEAREVKKLCHVRVGQQIPEPRRRVSAGHELNEMSISVAGRQLDQAQPVATRVEPHCLGVDGDDRPEIEPFGKITAIKPVGHSGQRSGAPRVGAQEKTRTSTSFRPLEPESSASTNSATWAPRDSRNKPGPPRCQSALPSLQESLGRDVAI